MALRLAIPDSVRRLPLHAVESATAELAAILAEAPRRAERLSGDLTSMAAEAVEHAVSMGAVLLAAVPTSGAIAPALLTGVPVAAPRAERDEVSDVLRAAVADHGGPDVRETFILGTAVGPVVVAHRVPGPEQQRAGRPLTLQLQAFIPEPGTAGMLVLTLASTTGEGWTEHQKLFGRIVASLHADDTPQPAEPVRPARVPRHAEADDESFENRTYIR